MPGSTDNAAPTAARTLYVKRRSHRRSRKRFPSDRMSPRGPGFAWCRRAEASAVEGSFCRNALWLPLVVVSKKVVQPFDGRTNGKAERFIQTSLREWAYARTYNCSHPAQCRHASMDAVPAGKSVQRLAVEELLDDLSLELGRTPYERRSVYCSFY